MEQELFKNIYHQIHLDKEQKDRLWQNIEDDADEFPQISYVDKKMGNRISFSARAAVFVGVLLVSGITVLAANEISLTDKLVNAVKLFTQNEQAVTEDEQNIYAKYGSALDNEVIGENGIFKLEAALYDKNFLFIPFQYIFNSDSDAYKNITEGLTLDRTTMWECELLAGFRQDHADLWYGVSQGSKQARGISNSITILNPEIKEDGILTGGILLSVEQERIFRQGDVIQVVRKANQPEITGKIRRLENGENTEGLEIIGSDEAGYFVVEEDYTVPDEILTEFTLGSAVEQQNVSIPDKQMQELAQLGFSVEELCVSSISINFKGIIENSTSIPYSASVVLKDGSTVGFAATGGISSSIETTEVGEVFSWCQLFDAPVHLDEIDGIWIYHGSSEVWIPVG
ncbi:MAG: hypothetical protein K2K46_07835 [Lachnospiraceae bacterium]|nr:hypothetical protein [Lachnospiraceae bacterium]